MKNIKKKVSPILYFIAGSVITFTGTVFAASQILASNVDFTPRDTSWNVDNAEAAINDLYYKVPGVPTGTVLPFMGNTAPTGYVICDGTEYNISSHINLANFIKEQFGSYNYFGGDGETTFKVPDLRGEFLRGSGTNSHSAQGNGSTVGTHQNGTIHAAIGASDSIYLSMAKGTNLWDGFQNADYTPARDLVNRYISTSGENSNKRIPYYTSRPTNTSVLYIIKY